MEDALYQLSLDSIDIFVPHFDCDIHGNIDSATYAHQGLPNPPAIFHIPA